MTRDNQISTIINRLEDLSIEVHELTQELRAIQQEDNTNTTPLATAVPLPSPLPHTTFEHPYKTGDKVIITNSYLGRKGTRGTVIKTTAKRVTIVDTQGRKHVRKPDNISYE